MKFKFLLLLGITICLGSTISIYAQTIGFHGAAYFENQTPQSDIWINEAVGTKDFVMRFPGGAAAKFCDPSPTAKGWGLNYALIDSIQGRYGSSEEEDQTDAANKWHRKSDAQPDRSYLNDMVILQRLYPKMKVIWCANIYISAGRVINALDYLISNGVKIVGVEVGNESYSQFNYDFASYWSRSQELRALLKDRGLKIYHPVPATGIRDANSHEQWVAALNAVIGTDGVCFHPYYDGREFPHLKQPVDTALAYGEIAAYDFTAQFKAMKAKFPATRDFIVTETNTQPSNLIGDTPLNAFFITRLLEAASKEFQYTCLHSGVTPDKFGIIYGTKVQKRNTSYYSFKAALGLTQLPVCRDTSYSVTDTSHSIIEHTKIDTVVSGTYPIPCTVSDRCLNGWYSFWHKKKCSCVSGIGYLYDTIQTHTYEDILIFTPRVVKETICE